VVPPLVQAQEVEKESGTLPEWRWELAEPVVWHQQEQGRLLQAQQQVELALQRQSEC
jgi:hypothetical protein